MKSSVVPRWGLFVFSLSSLLTCFSASGQIVVDREPPGPCTRRTGLVITEIMYNPRPVDADTNRTLEFLEFYNANSWAEDISGFFIDGAISYTFPTNTILPANGYVVVARVPELIQQFYGVTALGPWVGANTNRLPTEGGTVRLRHRQGALFLSVTYQDSPPWPEAADGAGHSLVLAKPSYGENDFRAWAESDVVGGSPGRADPRPNEPLASVVINEWQNHSDPVDWLELYNHSNVPVDLSGAWLSDDPAIIRFRIPDGTIIQPRGFLSWDQTQLGFELFAGGETIFFWNAAQTRVIDVIDFRGQSNNITSGRWPDGAALTYGLSRGTRGGPNARPMRYPVVINEIMFNPISGSIDEEYIELHNRNPNPVDVTGWEFVTGIGFYFPTNALTRSMPGGAYWVVARNPTNLAAIYTNLNTNVNLFGPYTGTLANGGERVVFTAADYDRVQNPGGGVTIEKLPVPISDVIYGDGGRWGNWSDGNGSSLELIDPEADERHPSNWADSNDTGESLWTHIEYNGPIAETLGSPVNDYVIIGLEGIGECLLDEVEVRVDNGPNLVANGGFESGLSGWTLQASHDFSTIEAEGFTGTRSLHIRAASRGENQSNRILSSPFATPIPPDAKNVTIRAKARWLRGFPEILLRLHGSATEAFGRMSLPRRLGSPGMPNSRRIANAGPAIYEVKHSPPLPAANEPVVVTARATDPQGVSSFNVRYRIDPAPAFTNLPLRDDGTGGDAVAGDGLFSATIPGQPDGTIVPFYVEARDGQNAIGTFPADVFPQFGFTRCWPNDGVTRECIVRWGDRNLPGTFPTYHFWLSSVNSNRWHTRAPMNNAPMDGTFVYNNVRVIYNALPLYAGSPFHRTNSTAGPAGLFRVDYEMNFPDDDTLFGSTDFILGNPGNPDVLTVSDQSAVAEQTVYKIFDGMSLPNNHRRYIHFFINGNQRSTAHERPGNFIFEDAQQPNGEMVGEWFPDEPGGQLFKVEDWFEFKEDGFTPTIFNDADLARSTVTLDGEETFLPGPYRFKFRKRSVSAGNSANDYTAVFDLISVASPKDDPNSATLDPYCLGLVVDWEAWMRHFSVQRIVGNWDSYGWERGKNAYIYKPPTNGFAHMPWDIDYNLGLGRPPNAPLFPTSDPRIAAMFNTPEIQRAYWRAFEELVNGPFTRETLDPFIDARVAALQTNNVNLDLTAVARIKTYIAERHAFVQSQVATVAAPFAFEGPTNFSTTNNLLVLRGTAPVAVKFITLNGAIYPVTWVSPTSFVMRVVLDAGVNALNFGGRLRDGTNVAAVSASVNATYTGAVPNPFGALLFSEILYAAPTPDTQFIEIVNNSPHTFGLSGWRIDGVGYRFPLGSILTNGQRIVLTRDKLAFKDLFPRVSVFGVFPGPLSSIEQILALVRPGSERDDIIDAVRYEGGAPWVTASTNQSLQLIDLAQDNSRVANWTVDTNALSTPGAPNSVAGTLPPFDPVWLNEFQFVSLTNIVDNAGEQDPWLELHNAGTAPVSLDGYFLTQTYTSNLTQWPLPAGITLAPGEYRLLWMDGQPEQTSGTNLHTPFRLEDAGRLALTRLTNGQPQITDYLTWPRLGANLSYGNVPDGQPVFRYVIHTPTPRSTNMEPPFRLFINEWMARNSNGIRDPADNARDDWFEIFNANTFAVNLRGFFLTDDPNDPMKFRVPTNGNYVIPSGGFRLVWADNQTNQNAPNRDPHASFQLGGSSGTIAIFAPDGLTLVDSITYGPQLTDVSEGRYADGANLIYSMPRSTPRGPNAIPSYNSPPEFAPIPRQFVLPGQTLTITPRIIDPDGTEQIFTTVLEAGPPGSLVNPAGVFRWIVPADQAFGDYLVALRVTDAGTPPRSAATSFIITVVPTNGPIAGPPPHIYKIAAVNGQASLSFEAVPGRAYRVLYKNDLSDPAWTPLDKDFVAANASASLTDVINRPHRFYLVQKLD